MDQKLSKLVEELTTSGEPQLNPEKMKELKKICKSSEEQLSHAYHLLMAQLSQEHAEVRLSAFRVVDELFARSHQFRTLVISNLQEFLELALGTDHERPLPPPREAAQRLRQAAARAVAGWNDKYGEAYKKLALGFHFLCHNKKVDFQDVNVRTVVERKREEERQKRLVGIYAERARQAEREMEEMSGEIRACLAEVDGCFRLLMLCDWAPAPRPPSPGRAQDLWEPEQPCCSRALLANPLGPGAGGLWPPGEGPPDVASGSSSEDEDAFVRSHGLGSRKYALDLELSADDLKVREDEDNGPVVHAAQDALRLVHNKFLPAVCSWVQLFTRAGIHDERLRGALDLKAELDIAVRKAQELGLQPAGGRRTAEASGDGDDDDDDDEFVEVPEKEGYEAHVPAHLRLECGLEPVAPIQAPEKELAGRSAAWGPLTEPRPAWDEMASDPTSATTQLQLPAPVGPSPSAVVPGADEARRLAAERARAPVVPFGVDLCYWGREPPAAGRILKSDSQHRFWRPSEVEEEVESTAVAEALQSRCIPFPGRFEPVQHRCRAPRPNGQLCARQDRLKCPFHGKIVPRDDRGQPLDPADRAREEKQRLQRQAGYPDWRDPEFLRDVEAATGVDLGSSGPGRKGRGKGGRRKFPHLTDLGRQADTARARLRRKVFAKAALRKAATAMNLVDQKKHEKFANQFNYALS
ncbi:UV-stimulated scaffold protein A isoform X1 [Dasypus novemcinctus]|uniref:UV-stimulated scaffold protein A isoform X1 n=1 Tax=Dasypus novemcinctus TaxID=9361 RepID=UPI00265FAA2F|nr:UV-stimulated scaffold protein A isoform X1 [Dasypus novemcinctus]XP_058157686.1 UV-stimulated scaffold protein A isoform X1 [Dasypus novemcinctus]XP_058157694.1 UV-stimulated scaffold protein A isoform X1 [Dasypus novemcinctus]XP_058157697.1 UV-stimulated scaffold protein A isoform X1 [Dasypus novemcinctus]